MRFVTFTIKNEARVGVIDQAGREVIDLKAAQEAKGGQLSLPNTMIEWIAEGDIFINRINELLAWVEKQESKNWTYSLANQEIKLCAPIPRPLKNIFCVGKNYIDHALEIGTKEEIPEYPMIFTKVPTTVIGPEEHVLTHEEITDSLDYEGELAVVIGKQGKGIKASEAMDYVFGYTILNDITARNIQKRHIQYFLGKSLDTACPMGPYIAHKSLVPNPHKLQITTKVNGEVRQQGCTDQFIFDIPSLISVISAGMTLEPGDIISTGTPAGVGAGFNPPRFLKAGDVVEIEIEGLGLLKNEIV
ncbi:MAG: fumarylacetoacetate hydrolase family protein [Bacillota bacterium]|nr:fumarylacetoacetate hydrolase family protein [Bacillota bacterium]